MFGKFIEKIGDKYDPSVFGASIFAGGLFAAGGIVGAIALGGATALVSGLSAAYWVGGSVLGICFSLATYMVAPFIVKQKCYAYTMKRRVKNGGSTTGMKIFPGIKKLSKLENQRMNNLFNSNSNTPKADKSNKAGPKQPQIRKPK